MSLAHHRPVWVAQPMPGSATTGMVTSPGTVDAEWLPLGQSWEAGKPGPAFQPGWARIRWHATGLHYDAVFMGAGARNAARQLNERTWELGDVGEIFVQTGDGAHYLEVHVTPENARLQLSWPADGLARVRGKLATLGEFMIGQTDWVESQTHQGTDFWAMRAIIPAGRLSSGRLRAGQLLRTAVCRYDYQTREPTLSSTAPLPVPFFHQRDCWHALLLSS